MIEIARNLPEKEEEKIVKIELNFFLFKIDLRCHELVKERKTFLA